MKKHLLILIFCTAGLVSNGQMALNEVYARPGNGKSEFFEIYNNAQTNIKINLDCFSVLTYWKSYSNTRGWYVLDFGPTLIPPAGFFTAASATFINTQNLSNITAGINWNFLPAGASLTKWQLNPAGTGYVQIPVPFNLNDLIEDNNGIGVKNIMLLYKQSSFAQGFLGGSVSNTLPSEVNSLPALTVATNGACTSQTFTFSAISGSPFLYYANPAAGNDNGYSRLFDGNCAPWDKSAPGNDHTPNASNNNSGNGGISPYDGSITTGQFLRCLSPTSSELVYNVTGMTGAATLATTFPVVVSLFTDLGTMGHYDPGVDVLIGTQTVFNTDVDGHSFGIFSGSPHLIILYSTANGCYDRLFINNPCDLVPEGLNTFNDNSSKDSQMRSVRGDGKPGKILVYPNPSNDGRVHIVFEDKDVVRDISVADMSGRIIKQLKAVSNNSIMIDNLSPGMYSIRILSVETGEQVVEKIVVNKR